MQITNMAFIVFMIESGRAAFFYHGELEKIFHASLMRFHLRSDSRRIGEQNGGVLCPERRNFSLWGTKQGLFVPRCQTIPKNYSVSFIPFCLKRYATTACQSGKASLPNSIHSPSNSFVPFFGRSSIR